MKKLYILSIFLITGLSFGQNLAVNGEMENWTAGVVDTWTSETGITVEAESTIISEGSQSAKITVATQTQGDTDFRQTINVVAGTTYDISFDVYQLDNESRARLYVDAYLNYSDDTLLNQWQTITNTFTAGVDGVIEVGLRFYDNVGNWTGAGSVMYVDNFQFTAQSTPSLVISNPADGSTLTTPDVNIELAVQNFAVATVGNGDGHISYTVNNGAAVDKFDTAAIALTGLATGNYTVYVELVDDAGNVLSPEVNATVSFDITDFAVVADLATLRADVIANGVGGFYELSNTPIITYERATRNQKYIQDATAGILIDDSAGAIATNMVIGDAISGLKGQVSYFNGVLQLIPAEDAIIASSGNTITPEIVTIADVIADVEMYESKLIQINNASFTDADGTVTFTASTNYTINDGTDLDFRTSFSEANYIDEIVPAGTQNLVVLVAEFNGTPQVVARDMVDIPLLETKSFNTIEGLIMYPNPLNGNILNVVSSINTQKSIQIFDVLGKVVLQSEVANNTVEVNLNSGIYIVKIIENGKVATRKLVIK